MSFYINLFNKYKILRHAERGVFFKKPKSKRIDPLSIEGVELAFDTGHVQGFVLKESETIIIMLMGSNELLDWLHNFWFRFKEIPYEEKGTNPKIKVHKGFYRSYLLIRTLIHELVKNEKKVIVFGHSFGGALTTLCSLDIRYNFPEIEVSSITTGSPRIGNEAFVSSFERRLKANIFESTRFVYGNDIVCGVPFKWLRYKHVGKEFHLGPKRRFPFSIKHHMMGSYEKGVKEI